MIKKTSKKLLIVIIIMVIAMALTILSLKTYVEKSIHSERVNYLSAQTQSTAELINSTIARYSSYAELCKNIVSEELMPGDNISSFVDKISVKTNIDSVRLILIDKNCTWYGENNTTGRISAMQYYAKDTADSLVYITTGVDTNKESICFRTRLDNPVEVITPTGTNQIEYCTIIYYLENMLEQFDSAFPFECNSFIVDESGLMLYRNYALGTLISGTNIFSKFERAKFLFNDSGEELLERLKQKEVIVGEMLINSENYFICASPLKNNRWYVCFVINSTELATGAYIRSIVLFMSIIGLAFAAAVMFMSIFALKTRASNRLLSKEILVNEYLEKASKAKDVFISNMSHDIRTPINGIMGMTAIAKKENNSKRTAECLEKIDISSNYLLSLVNDVLDMSAIENNKLSLDFNCFNIMEFISSCIAIIEGQAQTKNISLDADVSGISSNYAVGDERKLRQIMINILSNAVKFTPVGGHVSFSVSEKDADSTSCQRVPANSASVSLFTFKIKDTGIGMSEEFLTHIWDRFSQSEAGARSSFKGSGLGMSIAKALTELMGGTIDVESELDKGSIFTVSIPMETIQDKSEALTAGNTDNNIKSLSGARILVAEDNEINMEIALDILSECKVKADPAYDGEEAVKKYLDSPDGYYDIILMDIMMPKLSGIEAAKAIRSSSKHDAQSIPIIAMTANTSEDDINETMEAGMDAHVGKPINIDSIFQAIASLYNK